jgi:hypothetical protein
VNNPHSYGSNHECEKECPTCGQVAIRGADGHYRPLEGSSSGPESEAVKLLRRCYDAGDLVTPLDETLREDVAAFFGGKDG